MGAAALALRAAASMPIMTGLIEHLSRRFLGARQRDEDDAREDAVRLRTQQHVEQKRALLSILGIPAFRETTILPLAGGGFLGPAIGPRGQELVWSVWAPHRRALIDIFRVAMPDEEEQAARAQFAREHGLRYAVVPPGWRMTFDDLKRWIEEGS